jgi:hypothetical protein
VKRRAMGREGGCRDCLTIASQKVRWSNKSQCIASTSTCTASTYTSPRPRNLVVSAGTVELGTSQSHIRGTCHAIQSVAAVEGWRCVVRQAGLGLLQPAVSKQVQAGSKRGFRESAVCVDGPYRDEQRWDGDDQAV